MHPCAKTLPQERGFVEWNTPGKAWSVQFGQKQHTVTQQLVNIVQSNLFLVAIDLKIPQMKEQSQLTK